MSKVCKFPENFQEVFDYARRTNEDMFGENEEGHLVISFYDEKHNQLVTKTYIRDDMYDEATYSKDGALLETQFGIVEKLD